MVQLQVDRMVCATSRRRKDGAVLWQLGGRIIQQGLKANTQSYRKMGQGTRDEKIFG